MKLQTPNQTLHQSIISMPHCTSQTKLDFIQQFQLLEFQKNQILISPNLNDQSLYFIQSGILRTFHQIATQTITRTIHIPGDYLLPHGAYIHQSVQAYTECVTDSQLLSINFKQIEKFIYQNPSATKLLLAILDTQNLSEINHSLLNHLSPASKRYAYAKQILGKHLYDLPKEILASYLNLSRKHLGRLSSMHARASE